MAYLLTKLIKEDNSSDFHSDFSIEWISNDFNKWLLDGCDIQIANKIKSLNLNSSNIDSISDSIIFLSNLNKLTLCWNNFRSIPTHITHLVNLEILGAGSNKIETIPETISEMLNLRIISFHNNRLRSIPETIGDLHYLEILYLSRNQLTYIPDSIGNLRKLKILRIDDNQLTEIPTTIGNLMSLQELRLNDNQLTIIPNTLYNLSNLKILSLSNNQLSNISDEIRNMTSIEYLLLGKNNLTNIPDQITNLINIRHLDLRQNHLTTLPIELGNLINICYLDLSQNQLRTLPASISRFLRRLLTIGEFIYDQNPYEYIPPQIQRILDGQRLRNNIVYNDNQSVHNTNIQESFRRSVEKLTSTPGLNKDELIRIISENSILTDRVKSQLFEYIEDTEPHITLNVNFLEVAQSVFKRIIDQPDIVKDEIFRVLNQEMTDALCMCFTGRITRLVNSLNGFDMDVQLQISLNEQLSNIILIIKERLENENSYTFERHREEVETEFRTRGIDENTIQEWINYI